MLKLTQVFFIGLLISFIGSLPLGTLNVAAMQIGIQENVKDAMYFSLGSLLVEMVYVRISLVGMDWVRKQTKVLQWLEWITFCIIAALAFGSFSAAMKETEVAKNIMLNNHLHRFFLGMMMSAINPVQIPFWFGWSTVLFTKNILLPQTKQYNSYILGIGVGTLLGNAVFIFGGKWLFGTANMKMQWLNWIIGGIFSATAIIQLIKLMRNKTALSSIKRKEKN